MLNAQLYVVGHIVYMCRELNMQPLCSHVVCVVKKAVMQRSKINVLKESIDQYGYG